MRAALIFISFVFVTLLLVYSEQTNKQQNFSNISSLRIIDINSNDCVIPAINFSFKKIFPELNFYQFRDEKLIENAYTCRIKLSKTNQQEIKAHVFCSIKQKPFRSKLLFTSEKDDSHYLLT